MWKIVAHARRQTDRHRSTFSVIHTLWIGAVQLEWVQYVRFKCANSERRRKQIERESRHKPVILPLRVVHIVTSLIHKIRKCALCTHTHATVRSVIAAKNKFDAHWADIVSIGTIPYGFFMRAIMISQQQNMLDCETRKNKNNTQKCSRLPLNRFFLFRFR